MNLQENIRRILREIEEDKIQIRLGRSAERHFGKVQNIIIMVDDQDITSEDDVPGLGKMNIVSPALSLFSRIFRGFLSFFGLLEIHPRGIRKNL